MTVNVKITHDPNNAGTREERVANLDAAAIAAMMFGWSCTITAPPEPLHGQSTERVYTFDGGFIVSTPGQPMPNHDTLEWWCYRASEPLKGSRAARVTIREASGQRHVVTLRGNISLVALTERYRVDIAIDHATAGRPTGLLEPKPGHVRGYDYTRRGTGWTVDIDFRGATVEAWEPNETLLQPASGYEVAAAPEPSLNRPEPTITTTGPVRPVLGPLGAIGAAIDDSVYAREVAARAGLAATTAAPAAAATRTYHPFRFTLDVSRLNATEHADWLERSVPPNPAWREIELNARDGDRQTGLVHAENETAARAAVAHLIGRANVAIRKIEGLS